MDGGVVTQKEMGCCARLAVLNDVCDNKLGCCKNHPLVTFLRALWCILVTLFLINVISQWLIGYFLYLQKQQPSAIKMASYQPNNKDKTSESDSVPAPTGPTGDNTHYSHFYFQRCLVWSGGMQSRAQCTIWLPSERLIFIWIFFVFLSFIIHP